MTIVKHPGSLRETFGPITFLKFRTDLPAVYITITPPCQLARVCDACPELYAICTTVSLQLPHPASWRASVRLCENVC